MSLRSLGPAVIAVAAGLALAACSSSSGGAGSSLLGAPASSGAAAGANSQPAAAGGKTVSCKQITSADVQPMLVQKIATVKTTAVGLNGDGQTCSFTGPAGNSGSLSVTVIGGSLAAQTYASDVADDSDGVETVPGVGDKASRDKGGGGVSALKGSVYCSVEMSDDDNFPGIGPLEDEANNTTDIADSAYAVESAAQGTLCNRIFGSGNTTPDLSAMPKPTGSSAPSGAGLPTGFSLPTDAPSS
jgi:hypothetical protein